MGVCYIVYLYIIYYMREIYADLKSQTQSSEIYNKDKCLCIFLFNTIYTEIHYYRNISSVLVFSFLVYTHR